MVMPLKPQDVMVLLAIALAGDRPRYAALAEALGMSPAEVHAAVRRATGAGLFETAQGTVNRTRLLELLAHGVRYVFWPERGGIVRGIPTAYAAPPLRDRIAQGGDPPPVWPHPEGTVRGESLQPLYKSAPDAARRDPKLYELLALVDALRIGRARDRKLAEDELRARLAP